MLVADKDRSAIFPRSTSVLNTPEWQAYRFNEVEQSPEAIGIYAWYGVLHVGPIDWKDSTRNGMTGESSLRSALVRHSQRFRPQELSALARRNWHVWKGRLKDERFQNFIERVLQGHEDGTMIGATPQAKALARDRAAVSATLSDQNSRGALVRVLTNSIPILSAPIYVGQTDNLQRRLLEHKSAFLSISSYDIVNPGLDGGHRDRELDKTFAGRAAQSGFSSENLVAWTLNIDKLLGGDIQSVEQRKQITKSAELLLNNWAHPVLGKR
jgi:hypothetical protein